jgi:hypothetical protein
MISLSLCNFHYLQDNDKMIEEWCELHNNVDF